MHKLTILILVNIGILLGSSFVLTTAVYAATVTQSSSNIALSIPVDKHPIGIAVNPNNNKM